MKASQLTDPAIDTSKLRSRSRRGSFVPRKLGVTALVVLAAHGSPGPAQAASRPTCDGVGGRTLAANTEARSYRVSSTIPARRGVAAQRPGWYVCSYASKVPRPLRLGRGVPENIGLSGPFVYDVETFIEDDDAHADVLLWDARSRRPQTVVSPSGALLGDVVLSARGVLGVIANSAGRPPYGADGITPVPATSRVLVFDLTARRPKGAEAEFTEIASAAPGTFTHLTAASDTLIWTRSDGTFGTAPFTRPAVPTS